MPLSRTLAMVVEALFVSSNNWPVPCASSQTDSFAVWSGSAEAKEAGLEA